ncbi:MAG: hypothetical protein R3D34_14095 [Nitratireductor sp.]
MKWQPMPAKARDPSGTLVEELCGQPEQKCAMRATGAWCVTRNLCRASYQSSFSPDAFMSLKAA